MPQRLLRIVSLRPRDLQEFMRAQAAVLVAHWLVWRRPAGLLIDPVQVQAAAGIADAPLPDDVARLLRAVNRAALYGLTRPKCLTRAVALMRLLEADGHAGAVLRIGVQWSGGDFAAHAWVELHGAVLDMDQRLHRPFAPITDAAVASAGEPA